MARYFSSAWATFELDSSIRSSSPRIIYRDLGACTLQSFGDEASVWVGGQRQTEFEHVNLCNIILLTSF